MSTYGRFWVSTEDKEHQTVPHRLRALAYEEAMETLAATYPDDVEAKILYALTPITT